MALKEDLYKAFHEPNAIQRYVVRKFLFNAFQKVGVHVTADHFYEVVPDTRAIARKYSDTPRALPGIDWRFAECETRALAVLEAHAAEYVGTMAQFDDTNPYFRGIDALMLYAIVRDMKPRKVVEIGQGYSTRIMLAALQRNAEETGTRPSFISVDPFARFTPEQVPAGISLELVQRGLQDVEVSSLVDNCELFFVDSSHVYKFDSDVALELTTVYPQLAPGTLLHVHDIFSPFEYPLDWLVAEKRFWNEQYALECFLMFNSAFAVALPLNLLMRLSGRVRDAVRNLQLGDQFQLQGSSFYISRT
jgi:hypothetical protein